LPQKIEIKADKKNKKPLHIKKMMQWLFSKKKNHLLKKRRWENEREK